MHQRCGRDQYYETVTISPRWRSYEVFLKDMGEKPKGFTLERKDNSKGYSKANCKWATRTEQQNNRRSNRCLSFQGKTKTVTQWARQFNISASTLFWRLNRGWDVKRALTQPIRAY